MKMELFTKDLALRTVEMRDIEEVARMWALHRIEFK